MIAGTINARETGTGEPTLVFVHGFACSLGDWDSQVSRLSDTYRCVAVDLPGHGATPASGQATIAAAGAALVQVVHERTRGPVVLVGHSMGAKVVREAYCQSPERIAGLVLIDGALYEGKAEDALARARATIAPAGFLAYIRHHFEEMCPPHWPDERRAAVVGRAGAVDPAFAEELYFSAVRFDPDRSLETLRRITVPTLVLQATHFDVGGARMPMKEGVVTPLIAAVTRLVKGSQARIIENSGHFAMTDAPDATAAAIRAFVNDRCLSGVSP